MAARKRKIASNLEDLFTEMFSTFDQLVISHVDSDHTTWMTVDGQHRMSNLGIFHERPEAGRKLFKKLADGLNPDLHGGRAELSVGMVVVPEKPVAEGLLVRSTSLLWATVVEELKDDWDRAYSIPWRVWEELFAGAFKKAGYDEVVLTPRSGDHGRDVIAIKKGIGSVRILGSMKAYGPGHLITKEEVHALAGVVNLDPNASKGIFATTSDFAPNVCSDPRLAAALPNRIELLNGQQLRKWLVKLAER